jgi:beta-lactam-binding protein with PASTA domain
MLRWKRCSREGPVTVNEGTAPRRTSRPFLRRFLDRDWALALALAFFVAVIVWFGRSVQDYFGGSAGDVLLPAFAGQTIDDANGECARLHLTCTVLARQPSEQYPRDVVMGQEPAAGAHVREGRAVSLVVSNGIHIFPMPDLRFESLRNVNLKLGNVRLQLAATKMVANNDVPANHVVDQNPPPLASVREGTAVTLTLSKGPPSSVKVPNFVNMNIDAARDAAQAAKVHLGQVVWTPFGIDGPARGTVVRQSPPAGRSIDPFAPTSLQVSAGPTVYGYIVRQVHVTAAIPLRDDTAHVRMVVRDATGTWNVYDGYAQGGQKLDLDVTAIGTSELDTYVNNELLDVTKFGVEPPSPAPSHPPSPAPSGAPH